MEAPSNWITILLICLCHQGWLRGQDAEPGNGKVEPPKEKPVWMQYLQASVQQYELAAKTDSKRPFIFHQQPVFVHRDTVAGDESGLLFLWKNDRGRPVAVVTGILMRWVDSDDQWQELHEYHSLSEESLTLRRGGRVMWRPSGPGVDWTEVPRAPEPATTGRRLEFQAKGIARRFRARGRYDDKDWDLRRIPTPVYSYHYKDADGRVVGGSLVIFCRATDPEVLLVLEVRKNEGGELRWHYGVGGFTNVGTFVRLDGRDVWSEDPARFRASYRHYSFWPQRDFNYKREFRSLTPTRPADEE